jgi:hypothetical protein
MTTHFYKSLYVMGLQADANCWIMCTCKSHRRREGDFCEAVHIEGKFRDQTDIQVESSTTLMNHVYFAGGNQMFIRACV